jgi:hypothetical protein
MSLHDQSQPFVPSEFAPKPMMTLRDYFAAKAMQGMLSAGNSIAEDFNPDWEGYRGGVPDEFATVAKEAYLMADAMLAERDK